MITGKFSHGFAVFFVSDDIDERFNYIDHKGNFLLKEHVELCSGFNNGYARIDFGDGTYNFINTKGDCILKENVKRYTKNNVYMDIREVSNYNNYVPLCMNTYRTKFIYINSIKYTIDKEGNFYYKGISFKDLYTLYPNRRIELIDIISKYTYYNINEYFIDINF